MSGRKSRSQGATEYLVVLGAVLLIAVVGVATISQATSTATLKEQQSNAYWKAATPFSILAYRLNENSLSIKLGNNLNEKIKLTSIQVAYKGANHTIYSGNRVVGSGEQFEIANIDLRFSAANPCNALASGALFEYDQIVFGYDKQSISGFVQTGDEPLVGRCGQQANLVNVSGDSPANGASAAQNFSLNLLIQSPGLDAMNFSFNGTSTAYCDPSLVLAMNFEDYSLAGDNDTRIADVSGYGNNGTVYDNTIGLWRFDEADNATASDTSRFGNNGAIYGPTRGLWRFDEGDNSALSDASSWGNNGTLYGPTLGLWRLDEGDNATARDSTGFANNGALYGNTIGIWRFDEGDNKTVRDASAYGNNGTIYGNTALLLHMDENTGNTTYDASAYAFNGTCVNSTGVKNCTWTAGKSLTGVYINGSQKDYINLSRSASVKGQSAASAEIWFKPAVSPIEIGGVYYEYTNTSGYTRFGIQYLVNGSLMALMRDNNAGDYFSCYSPAISVGTWHHLAMTMNADTDVLALYIDGTINCTNTMPKGAFSNTNTADDVALGAYVYNSKAYPVNGSIDEFALYNKSLSSAEVLDHYNAGKAKFAEWNASGKSNTAIDFDGIQTFVNVSVGRNATAMDRPFSAFAWVYLKNNSNVYARIVNHDVLGNKWVLALGGYDPSTGRYSIGGTPSGNRYGFYGNTSAMLELGRWYYVGFTYDNATFTLYVNDTAYPWTTASGTWAFDDTNTLMIGKRMTVAPFNGSIDEVAIYNRSLNAAEVSALYAEGRARFIEWTSGKSGTGLQFDGKDDYISMGNPPSLSLRNAITVEAWVNITPGGTWKVVAEKYVTFLTAVYQTTARFSVAGVFDMSKNIGYDISGTLTHVAYAYDSDAGYARIFVNGAEIGNTTATGSIPKTNEGLVLGKSQSGIYYFNGTLDEVAIYNRSLSPAEILLHYNAGKAKFAEWAAGKSGSALQFGGTQDYVNVSTSTVNFTYAMSVSAWVKREGGDGAIVTKHNENRVNGWQFSIFNEKATFDPNTNSVHAGFSSNDSIPAGAWTHVAATYDNNTASIYVNGVLSGVRQVTGSIPQNNLTLLIGASRANNLLNYQFNGSIDEVQVASYALNATEVASLYNAGKAKFTERNTAGKSGNALRFDGQNDYVKMGNVPASNTLSVFAWVKGPAQLSKTIASKGDEILPTFSWAILSDAGTNAGTRPRITLSKNGSDYPATVKYYISSLVAFDGSWHHVGFTFNNNVLSIYVDGILDTNPFKNYDVSITNLYDSSAPLITGGLMGNGTPGWLFNGTIDEVLVINRSLSASEIQDIYAAGRAKRDSWDANGKWGSGIKFDGIDDYACTPYSPRLDRTATDFSIGAWIKLQSYPSSYVGSIVSSRNSSAGGSMFFVRGESDATYKRKLSFDTMQSAGTRMAYGTTELSLGQWYYATAVFDYAGANDNTARIYLNGNLETTTASVSNILDSSNGNCIGFEPWAAPSAYHLNGSIDEVRIWNRALTDAEIQQQYYGSLTKFAPDSWLFSYNRTFVPAGTYYYYGYVRSSDGLIDYTDNRSIVVT